MQMSLLLFYSYQSLLFKYNKHYVLCKFTDLEKNTKKFELVIYFRFLDYNIYNYNNKIFIL